MRIAAKTATYSVMHFVVTFCVGYFVTGDMHIALGISLLEPLAQITCFAVHEHLWEKFKPGSSKHTPKTCCADANLVGKIPVSFKQKEQVIQES